MMDRSIDGSSVSFIIDSAFAIKVLQAGRVSSPYQDLAESELSMSANSIVAFCSDKLIVALALLGVKVLQCRAIDNDDQAFEVRAYPFKKRFLT